MSEGVPEVDLEAQPASARPRIRIWDLPTRAFHWLLVLLIPAMWWTGKNDQAALHVTLGLFTFALVLFRLIWGVMGSSTARFAHFLKGPRRVMSYLNGRAAHAIGHNPIGGWSVAALLAVLSAQIGLGLFASNEDGDVFGPLSLWIDEDLVETVTELHEWLFNVLLALIALHIAAIAFYRIRGRRLTKPMITGKAVLDPEAERMKPGKWWVALLCLAAAIGITRWVIAGVPPFGS